ncbi:MAG: ABC transporter ATP-binding protein [Planctomycetes bacterium]|nr:ABC transporter ATP-binding protein [Planctomycetota bacterium]
MIEARGLVKRFGPRLALRGVDLDAAPGDVVGVIGPNGAGKTTTIRILATLIVPEAGHARVAGLDAVRDAARLRAAVGFMPERFGLYDELTIEQYLEFFARAHGLHARDRRAQVDGVLELTDLTHKRGDPCEGLSKGVRQRVYLAKTLLHDPRVLLLDEPSSGLDPQARIDLRALLSALAAQGKTILVSSHILTELDLICSRVAVIEGGRVRFAGTLDDVARRRARAHRVRVRALDPAHAERARALLADDARVLEPALEGRELRLVFEGEQGEVPGLHRRLVEGGVDVFAFEVEEPSLEALFLEVTRGEVS